MYVLAIILGVALFNIVVTGQTLEKRHISLKCALLRCYMNVDCERELNNRCCLSCPQEKRCNYKGRWYDHGQSFKSSCNSCFCNNGNVGCTKMMCPPGCTHKELFYTEGSTFKDGCNTCTCEQEIISCTEMACEGCQIEGKYYKDGETFKVDCNTCTCRNGLHLCTQIACEHPERCLYKGKPYKMGESMPSERKCWYCYCRRCERYCTPPMCPACERPIRPGQCCPDCSGIGLQTEPM